MTATLETIKVLDSPAFAWNNWVEREEILDMDFLDAGFQDEMNAAAIRVFSRELATSWNARACTVTNLTEKTYAAIARMEFETNAYRPGGLDGAGILLPDGPLTEEVWAAAANRMSLDAILAEAGLKSEYSVFVHAQSDYDL